MFLEPSHPRLPSIRPNVIFVGFWAIDEGSTQDFRLSSAVFALIAMSSQGKTTPSNMMMTTTNTDAEHQTFMTWPGHLDSGQTTSTQPNFHACVMACAPNLGKQITTAGGGQEEYSSNGFEPGNRRKHCVRINSHEVAQTRIMCSSSLIFS